MKAWIVAFLLLFAFGMVGTIDAQEAEKEQAFYCEQVKRGKWPDYDQSYVTYCYKEFGPILAQY